MSVCLAAGFLGVCILPGQFNRASRPDDEILAELLVGTPVGCTEEQLIEYARKEGGLVHRSVGGRDGEKQTHIVIYYDEYELREHWLFEVFLKVHWRLAAGRLSRIELERGRDGVPPL